MTRNDPNYLTWKSKPDFPSLDERQALLARTFIERIVGGEDFSKPLYRHQTEAILRVIYCGEKLNDWDVLLDIVTGGGKTVIMAALISYFWQVRNNEKFLVLTPNTIVRERVKDDFEVRSPMYAYRDFPFFFNSYSRVPERLTCKVLREGTDATSVRDANIIVANIHQMYEGRQSLEMLLSDSVVSHLVIFNDEAHNASAREYREVLKLLKVKTAARIDLTATPYRLDREDLDTYPPIYEYHVQEAINDRVVKQVVVTKPDIESVKLQYEEWDEQDQVVRTLDAEEMPWEEIEAQLKRGGAVRFVTAEKARRQQLQIAQSCIDYQLKQVPRDLEQKTPLWHPLLLVVALSQKDAQKIYETLLKKPFKYEAEELLLAHSKQDERENKKAFLLGRKSADGLSRDDKVLWQETRKVKVIIAVSMLREGWDVRNISGICLFRKFTYQMKGDRTYTVYGPQIIGRGLRRIRPPNEPDYLFTIDHPAFNHGWLWELLAAQEYAKPLNPNEKIEEQYIKDIPQKEPDAEKGKAGEDEQENTEDWIRETLSALPNAPEIVPIPDWKKHFTEFDFQKRISSAMQKITNVKSQKLGSTNTSHEIPEDAINVEWLNEEVSGSRPSMPREQMIAELSDDIAYEPHQALMSVFRQETAEQLKMLSDALVWLLQEKFSVDGTQGIATTDDGVLRKMRFQLPQILEEFRRPEVILGILGEQ